MLSNVSDIAEESAINTEIPIRILNSYLPHAFKCDAIESCNFMKYVTSRRPLKDFQVARTWLDWLPRYSISIFPDSGNRITVLVIGDNLIHPAPPKNLISGAASSTFLRRVVLPARSRPNGSSDNAAIFRSQAP